MTDVKMGLTTINNNKKGGDYNHTITRRKK